MPGAKPGEICGRRATCWHIGRDVPCCERHAARSKPGQVNPSPCCGFTMKKDGNKFRCPCGYRWSEA